MNMNVAWNACDYTITVIIWGLYQIWYNVTSAGIILMSPDLPVLRLKFWPQYSLGSSLYN